MSRKKNLLIEIMGTSWRSWLRQCAAERKLASSVPTASMGFLIDNPARTMALGSTQPLTEISNMNTFLGVKAAGA
jgi:hypothetical protein